jgi:ATP-dependent DNA helicase RecQ
LTLVLETISILKEKFKAEHIVDILKGNETSDVVSYQHNELENFGAASDEDEKLLQAVIRQALISGYITKDVETYGVLKITPKGKDYLKNPTSFPIVKDNDFEEDEEVNLKNIASTSAADEVLFSILKDLRKKLSKKLDVPPFVIFQDPSLEAMATTYPITMDELQNIPGVGAGKAKRYGDEFLKVIKEYVKENDIIRPEDLRVRTVANKSKLKVSIIQAIDRKIALDDIALSKGLDITELLDEIEAIVYSGTKINIDYFLEDVMDADRVDEIFEYFNSAETDSIDDALDKLGIDDFSETEIRLVRIKFLSEVGN